MCVLKSLNKNKINQPLSKLNPAQDEEQEAQDDVTHQGGADDDQDKEDDQEIQATRPQAPHPRVHQVIQRDHLIDMILGDIQKGVTLILELLISIKITLLCILLSLLGRKTH